MPVGVKRLVQGIDGGDAVPPEYLQELVLHHAHPLNQGPRFARLLGRGHGPVQVVEHGQQLESQIAVPVAPFLLALAPVALLIVLEIGLGPLQQTEKLVTLLGPCPQAFQVLQHGRGCILLGTIAVGSRRAG